MISLSDTAMAEVYTCVISQANVTATTAPSTGNPTRKARVSRRKSRMRKNFVRSRLTTRAVSATSRQALHAPNSRSAHSAQLRRDVIRVDEAS